MVGNDIMNVLEEQKRLEKECENLLSRRAQLKGLANKSKYIETDKQIKDVSKQLREITNTLSRNLKENPNLNSTIKKMMKERSLVEDIINNTIEDLRDGRFDTLTKQIDIDNKERNRLGELQRQEKELRDAVRQLEENIKKEEQAHIHAMRENNEKILQLKKEIQEKSKATSEEIEYRRKEARAKLDTELNIFKAVLFIFILIGRR